MLYVIVFFTYYYYNKIRVQFTSFFLFLHKTNNPITEFNRITAATKRFLKYRSSLCYQIGFCGISSNNRNTTV